MDHIRIKRLDDKARMPTRAYEFDAGLDLYALEDATLFYQKKCIKVRTGIAVEVRPGFKAAVLPRSSMSDRSILTYTGTIDCGYIGEVMVLLQNMNPEDQTQVIRSGEKIAQLVIYPVCIARAVEGGPLHLYGSRGYKGFGSSGV